MTFESIINIALKILAFLVSTGAITAVWKWMKAKKTKDATAQLDAANAIAAAKEAVIAELPALVTAAEKEYGAGAGTVKLAQVTAWAQTKAAALLPDSLKTALPADWISEQVDKALAKMRALWKELPALVSDGASTNAVGFVVPDEEL